MPRHLGHPTEGVRTTFRAPSDTLPKGFGQHSELLRTPTEGVRATFRGPSDDIPKGFAHHTKPPRITYRAPSDTLPKAFGQSAEAPRRTTEAPSLPPCHPGSPIRTRPGHQPSDVGTVLCRWAAPAKRYPVGVGRGNNKVMESDSFLCPDVKEINMSNATNSPGPMFAALKAITAGLQNPELPTACTQITVNGKVSSLTDLATEFAAMVKVYQTEVDAGKAHKEAHQARVAQEPAIISRYEAVGGALKIALGKQSPHLVSLGLKPNKTRTPPTPEQLQERVVKGRATRKARGTLGKNQKKSIHGTVPAPSPTTGK